MKVAKIVLKIVWFMLKTLFVLTGVVFAWAYTGVCLDYIGNNSSKFYEQDMPDVPEPGEHMNWALRHLHTIKFVSSFYAHKALKGWNWFYS